MAAGFDPSKIAFAGVGKTDEEILLGLEAEIGVFNVESREELEVIAGLAAGCASVCRHTCGYGIQSLPQQLKIIRIKRRLVSAEIL